MPALDLIRPSVTAMRVIASVNADFARELKLPPHIRSLGLISADSDDVTYIAADEATKQAMVEVVYGRSLYAGAAHGPSPTAGEVLVMLGGPNPAEVRAGLDAMVAHIENGAAFQWANDKQDTAFLAHVVSRTGSYLSSTAGITLGDPLAYLVAPPLEATYGIDAALKAANVRLLSHEVPDPGRLTLVVEGDLAACRAALDAGCAAAMRTGRVISRKEIGRPDDDTQWLVAGFNRQPKQPDASAIAEGSADELLALLTSVRQGMTAGEVAAHFGWTLEKARNALEQLFSAGTLRKRSSRYRLKPH